MKDPSSVNAIPTCTPDFDKNILSHHPNSIATVIEDNDNRYVTIRFQTFNGSINYKIARKPTFGLATAS